jgi:hypothetical protein
MLPSSPLTRFAATFALLFLPLPALAQTFQNPLLIPTSSDPGQVTTADVNGDGKLDLIYLDGNQYGQMALHILLGKGNGNFVHSQDVAMPSGICCGITIADVTGDGRLDIILQGALPYQLTSQVAVLPGNGDGTFQAPIVTTFQPPNIDGDPGFVSPVNVGDINGDGKADLVVTDTTNGVISLLLGNNSGSFTFASSILTYTRSTTYLTDLNGDGKLDIIATDNLGALFEVFLGNGDGTFQNFVRYSLGTSGGGFILTDVDGDGLLDMLASVYPNQIVYFKGNANGTFAAFVTVGSVPSGNQFVGVGDFNGDHIVDLAFVNNTGVGVTLGLGVSGGAPAFSGLHTTLSGGSTNPYSTYLFYPNFVPGDFNGDGKEDLAMPVEGGISILLSKGDGTFDSVPYYDMGQEVGAAAVAQFSGDGHEDIAVTLPATFPRLLLGDGTGNFTLGPDPNPSYMSTGADTTLLVGDFNGDGKPDLNISDLVPNESSAGTQSVALNLGHGVFATPVVNPNGSTVMADFNGDGRTDILDINGEQVIVSLGQADGSFKTANTTIRIASDPGHANVGDVNNDGKPDLIINYGDHMEVWLGNGDGTFTYATSTSLQNIGPDDLVAVADVDGDGKADAIYVPNANPAVTLSPLEIFYGNGDGTFQAPVSIPLSHRYVQVVVADINNDGKPDMVLTDGASVAVMLNLGNRTFDSEVHYIAGRAVSALNVVDVNSDGYPDIVVANTGGTTVAVLLNQPQGTSGTGSLVSGTLSITPEPSVSGQPLTVTLTVASQASGGAVPTGQVSFTLDGVFLADVTITNGKASYTISSTLLPIAHMIGAAYSGDATYAPKNFAVEDTILPPTYATTTALSGVPATILATQTIRLTASVSSTVAVPNGVVTFLDGAKTLGAETINSSGVALFDTGLLAPGAHTLSAKYAGFSQIGFTDTEATYVAAIFSPSTSASSVVTITTNATATSLAASTTSPTAGTVVTFRATTTSAAGAPFGGVSFFDGTTLLGTLSLDSSGSAAFSTASLATGPHTITATFNANGPYASSTSTSFSESISAASTDTAPTVASLVRETDAAGTTSSLSATISSTNSPSAGTVTFLDNGMILGSMALDGAGVARLLMAQLTSGVHTFTASYSGTSQFAPSASPILNEVWPTSGPAFALQIQPSAIPARTGAAASFQITVSPLGNFQQIVQLSCASGLPQGYSCEFSPNGIAGAGTSLLDIVSTAQNEALPWSPKLWPTATLLTMFAMLLGVSRWRGYPRLALALATCSLLLALVGCGATSSPTEVRTFVVTVKAAVGQDIDAVVHSAEIQVHLRVAR